MTKPQLLLAEDDPMMATLLSYRLEQSGYQVHNTNNGNAVKELLTTIKPDAIICDIMMPYYSGLELLDYVRNTLKLNTPFILISAAANDKTILNAFTIGANDFLAKPISPNVLIARLQKELKNVA